MARVSVEFGELIIEIEAIDQLWALRCQLEIPLSHVRVAANATDLAHGWQGRAQEVPTAEALRAGRFHQLAGSVFWDVRDPAKAVVLELEDERCARLVVEVDDPAAVIARINRAITTQERNDG